MTDIQIRLFGSPSILQNNEPVSGFISSKATALIYYLAANNRSYSRDSLAALFWADVPESRAKKNLRDILSNLRKVMGPHLDISRTTVALTVPPENVDSSQFEALVTASQGSASGQAQVEQLKVAADLQAGDFLDGFNVSDAPTFEEWVTTERQRFRQLSIQVFGALIDESMHSGSYLDGIDYALRSLALDPMEERTHRHLMSLYAANGQYAAALEQYERCCQILYDELGGEPTAETTALFDTIQTRQENPAARSIVDDHLLPFVGRTHELTEISRLLASSDCRILTLVGLGGIGKSRLAIQAAIQNEHRFLDGTYLITVGPNPSLGQFVTDMASAVGLLLSGDKDEVAQLLDFVREKSMFVVIDSAESLLEESLDDPGIYSTQPRGHTKPVELLGQIVAAAPGTKLMATSREHLGLRSEWVFNVNGLNTPAARTQDVEANVPKSHMRQPSSQNASTATQSSSNEELQSDAVQLFLRRARQSQIDFAPNDADLSRGELVAIGQICQLVDGMPLAIELAAGWVSILSCREIMREVMSGMDLLASTARDLPERHRSMQAIFDHSWQMIDSTEQSILGKLALFQGGFSRKAAQAVADASLPLLQSLLQRSFIAKAGKERFVLHNLLQQFALQKLAERPDELRQTQEQHARYFSRMLMQNREAILSEQMEVISLLTRTEMDNLRVAYDWALANRHFALLAEMLDGLYHIYRLGSWLTEGITRFNQTIEVLRQHQAEVGEADTGQEQDILGRLAIRLGRLCQMLGHYTEAQRYLQDGWAWVDPLPLPLERALCLLGQANVHFGLAEYSDAAEAGRKSLALYQQESRPLGTAHSLFCLGRIYLATGEYTQAKEYLSQVLVLAHSHHLRATEAECLGVLGEVCWNQGELTDAQTYFEDALALFQLPYMANPLSEARVLNELGFVAWSRGLYESAHAYHIQARNTFHRIGNRQGEGTTLGHLGRVAERRLQYDEASRLYAQSLVINQQIHDRQGEAVSYANLAFVAFHQGNFAQADDYFLQCRHLCQAIQFRRYEALAIACLGLLACFRKEYTLGENLANEAIQLAQQINDPIMEAYGWVHLGYALTGQALWQPAAKAYAQGLSIRRNSDESDRLLDPLSGLAYVALQQSDPISAQPYVDEIVARLNAQTLASALLPNQIHYVCYELMKQQGDPEAEAYLRAATEKLVLDNSQASTSPETQTYQREPTTSDVVARLNRASVR